MIGTQIRKFRRKQRFGLSEYAHRAWMCKIRMSPVARGIKYPSIEKNHSITAALQSPLLTLFLNGIDYQRELVTKDGRMVLPVPGSDYFDDTPLYYCSNPNGVEADFLAAVTPHWPNSRRFIHWSLQ